MELPYHRLLNRQIRRFVAPERIDELRGFFESVSQSYEDAEKERRMLEHTLDVSSKELEEANRSIKRQHEEMHDSILNALNIGLFAVDLQGKVIFANESGRYILGRKDDDMVGSDIRTFVKDDAIMDIIEYGVGFGRKEGDAVFCDDQQMCIPIRYSAYALMDNGIPRGTVFSFSDLTLEQKREELIDLQQLALESTATMMIIADKEGNIQYANKEFTRISGYELEELTGEDSRFIFDDTLNPPRLVQECWGRVSNGLVWEGEIRAKTKSGVVYFEELSVTPLVQKGRITNYVAVKKDISERIRTQEEIKQARDEAIVAMNQAKEANRAKDTFLSNMSHELRTPLNAIIGFSQILTAKSDTPAGVKVFIEKILISGKSLLSLVNTILDFSKIEAGKMEVVMAAFLMDELSKEVKVLIEPMAEKKNLRVECELQEGIMIHADRQLMKQVLTNLLSNAIKFSPNGDRILLRHITRDGNEICSIQDHGPGIPEDKIESLFDPFVQIREHQSEAVKGTGLGLSIVKKIVELHGGDLWVESVEGEGSTFYFSIPSIQSGRSKK